MSTIADFRTSIHRAKNVEELAGLLNNADPKFTFWGSRQVVNRSKKEVPLDFVTSKAISLITPLLDDKGWNFTEPDRVHIRLITNKINRFYKKTDSKLEESNLLTKIVYLFRNIFSIFYSARKKWDELCKIDPPNYYSILQFNTTFPSSSLPLTPDRIQMLRGKKHNLYLPPPTPPPTPTRGPLSVPPRVSEAHPPCPIL